MLTKTFKDKTVLITGHTGFKGSWLTAWLVGLGAKVIGISKDIPTDPACFDVLHLAEKITDYRRDVCDHEFVSDVLNRHKPDFVFHLAAQPLVRLSYVDPVETWHSNLMGTVGVLEALRRYGQEAVAVFITTDKCYDNVEWVWGYREDDRLGGPDPYSGSKGASELAIKSYVKSFFPKGGPIRLGVGRAGNVIGGGDWAADRIVVDCIKAWAEKKPVTLRRPKATRPWQHVLEPLGGYLTLAQALTQKPDLHGEAFNFGPRTEKNHSVDEVANALAKHWQGGAEVIISEDTSTYEAGLLKLNCDKALFYLHWHGFLSFEETTEMTALWYKNFYQGKNSSEMSALTTRQIASYQAKLENLLQERADG